MRFLIDAQLPRRMADWLKRAGHDAVHTLDLPDGNRTTDAGIAAFAEYEDRVVVTKDADFVDRHLLNGRPGKLLLVSTGNISNAGLKRPFLPLVADVAVELQSSSFLELNQAGIIVRG